jgi:Flp pilus assembly protein TadG
MTAGAGGAVRSSEQRGTITLWLLGLCLMLFALGGISVDLWRSFSARRALASGADAAALAGASAIDEGRYRSSGVISLVPAIAEHRARSSLARQPDQAALRSAEVRATDESVTVVVRGNVSFTLLGLFGDGDFDVEVVATAIPRRSS